MMLLQAIANGRLFAVCSFPLNIVLTVVFKKRALVPRALPIS